MADTYRENWEQIRTTTRIGHIQDKFNVRLPISSVRDIMLQIFAQQTTAYKINVSPGYILRNTVTQELRYFYPCCNNVRAFEQPFSIRNRRSLETAILGMTDLEERLYDRAYAEKPGSQWFVEIITNLSFTVDKIIDHPIGAARILLPDYVQNNAGLNTLTHTSNGPIMDSLCLFRCLALYHGAKDEQNLERKTKELFDFYISETRVKRNDFKGITSRKLEQFQDVFEVDVQIYELRENGTTAELIHRPSGCRAAVMNVNRYEDHFCFISKFSMFAKSFVCSRCSQLWKTSTLALRHENNCDGQVRHKFPGGVYKPPRSVYEELEEEGVYFPIDKRAFPYRATFDAESYFQKLDKRSATGRLVYEAEHVPMSIAVSSNVPGFCESTCFVSDGDSDELVTKMMQHLNRISTKSQELETARHSKLFKALDKKIAASSLMTHDQSDAKPSKRRKKETTDGEDEDSQQNGTETGPSTEETRQVKHLNRLRNRLENHIKQLPVIGFNSGKYDINALKRYLMPYLLKNTTIKHTIKRVNNYMAISTENILFLDISNYIAPGYSYDKFIRAFNCTQKKGQFCFEYMDSLDRLAEDRLPPREAFYSHLKKEAISADDYSNLEQVWIDENMQSVRDFLVWYNKLDVDPFLEALQKYADYYARYHLDPFKDAISISGLALNELFQDIDAFFYLFPDKHKDLFYAMKENIVGGPSIVYHRFAEKNVTTIRPERGEEAKTVKSVKGFDANSLYLFNTTECEQPTGMYVLRREERGFRPEYPKISGRMALEWLDHLAKRDDIDIQHAFNGGEKRVGDRRLPVDGFCRETNTVYQFQGCWWHGHDCETEMARVERMAELHGPEAAQDDLLERQLRLAKTKMTNVYITSSGYRLVEIWECDWKEMKEDDEDIAEAAEQSKTPFERRYKWSVGKEKIVQAIKDDLLYGVVEVDISVPEEWPDGVDKPLPPKQFFEDMQPIFKNALVGMDSIGRKMRKYVEENDLSEAPRRMLVGSYFATKIMLTTPLLQFYLKHGLVITRVYRVIEYHRSTCFREKGRHICDQRREADADPTKAVLGDTAKNRGNSYYGKTNTNKLKHRKVKYGNAKKASRFVNDRSFHSLNEITSDCYEAEMLKKTVSFDLPIQIAFFVYCAAKLKMLQFYYDFLDHYFDRSDYQLLEMDTDSNYVSFSATNIFDIIKKGKRHSFFKNFHKWFPSESCEKHREKWISKMYTRQGWKPKKCCRLHRQWDSRTSGLFKIEWEGDGMICLCSKTYYAFGESGEKASAKGVNKRTNTINKEVYLNVLTTGKRAQVKNVGFRPIENEILTYTQEKTGFTYNYWKRRVRRDGISTRPTTA